MFFLIFFLQKKKCRQVGQRTIINGTFASFLQASKSIRAKQTGRLRATAGARLPRVKGECIGASYIYAIDPTSIVRT